MKRVLITGAGGKIGTSLREGLRKHYELRLLDRTPQAPGGPGEEVLTADLNDRPATEAAMRGVDGVVHLGAIPSEAPFDAIVSGNITTTYSVYEAARRAGVRRVVFASSNHATGFYPAAETIGPEHPVRPDTFYGVSKVVGEVLGRLYADKYGLEVVCLRIGSFASRPRSHRQLATWLSPRDCLQLVHRSLEAPGVGFGIVYGVSANTRRFWRDDAETLLGYRPEDDSEAFAGDVEGPPPGEPTLADLRQGGPFVEEDPT